MYGILVEFVNLEILMWKFMRFEFFFDEQQGSIALEDSTIMKYNRADVVASRSKINCVARSYVYSYRIPVITLIVKSVKDHTRI